MHGYKRLAFPLWIDLPFLCFRSFRNFFQRISIIHCRFVVSRACAELAFEACGFEASRVAVESRDTRLTRSFTLRLEAEYFDPRRLPWGQWKLSDLWAYPTATVTQLRDKGGEKCLEIGPLPDVVPAA